MIIANLATYPPREASLKQAIERLSPQVDRLNIVLNEYRAIPQWEVARNVNFILPPTDLKDCGKFYPQVGRDDLVFLVDDDIVYPPNYVRQTEAWLRRMPNDRFVVGYHGGTYHPIRSLDTETPIGRLRLRLLPKSVEVSRKVTWFRKKLELPTYVDQLGTGTTAMWGRYMPSFDYMKTSQKFVDVRFAKWCFAKKITPVCLPREQDWLLPIEHEETIYKGFTLSAPQHVEREIRSFSLRRKNIATIFQTAKDPELSAAPSRWPPLPS